MQERNRTELMDRAWAISPKVSGHEIRQVLDEVLAEADRVERALADDLWRGGVPTVGQRDAMVRRTLDAGQPLERWPYACDELAAAVRDGRIRLDDERIRTVVRGARLLREAMFAGGRLEGMLGAPATPLVIPEHRDPLATYVDGEPRMGRAEYVHKYGPAIPSRDALAAIAGLGRPVLQFNSRGNYWGQLLREQGVSIIAFDREPNPLRNLDIGRQWAPVRKGRSNLAFRYPDRALLLIWPPYDSSMALTALRGYRGDHVIYVGEGYGDPAYGGGFHKLLATEWDLVETVEIPRWDGYEDRLTIHSRRRS